MDNSYEAMERMLELGMGATLAQQMMRTMSQCIQQTQVPMVQLQPPAMPTKKFEPFYAVVNENVAGPFDEQQLIVLAKTGKLVAETHVWKTGMSQWMPAAKVPETNKILILHTYDH